jgi:hypothetical protein
VDEEQKRTLLEYLTERPAAERVGAVIEFLSATERHFRAVGMMVSGLCRFADQERAKDIVAVKIATDDAVRWCERHQADLLAYNKGPEVAKETPASLH